MVVMKNEVQNWARRHKDQVLGSRDLVLKSYILSDILPPKRFLRLPTSGERSDGFPECVTSVTERHLGRRKMVLSVSPGAALEQRMVTAVDLREGMALRIGHEVYRVLEVEQKAGAAKMGGTVRARLSNVHSGRLWDQHFRPLERLENVELEKRRVEFLYSEGPNFIFQRLDTFDQIGFPADGLDLAQRLLQAGTELQAEFFSAEPISILWPDSVEARIVTTAPPARSQQDAGRKDATLDNGLTIQVPLFLAPGDTVSIDFKTGKYLERVRNQAKRGT